MLKNCKTVTLVGAQYQYSSVRLLARVCAADGRFLFWILQTARHRALWK
jgi:hypothetical protein